MKRPKKAIAFVKIESENDIYINMDLYEGEKYYIRTYGGQMPNINPINPPKLTELGLKLAGF